MYESNINQPHPEIKPTVLSDAETFQRGQHIYKIYLAASMRDSSHPQFDGMTYLDYNETNEKADNAFIPPKLNKYDTRTNIGLARQKISTMTSLLTNFEFEPMIEAMNDDGEPLEYQGEMIGQELGMNMTDLVRKSREIENYDEKRPLIYRELLRQGDVVVRDRCVDRYYKEKLIRSPYIDFSKSNSIQWTDAERSEEILESHLIDGKKIFLGDIRNPDIRMQPYVFSVEYITRAEAESTYGYFERFAAVPFYVQKTMWTNDNTIFTDWVYAEINQYKVEIIEFMDKVNDEYQLYLNGIPMLPCIQRANGDVSGFPLSIVSPSGEYPLARGSLQPLALFAYSKSIAAELKVDEAIGTEAKRIAIIKFQQSAFPPSGNVGNKVFAPDLWMPGKIHQGVSGKDIESLMKNPGLTPADFDFIHYIEDQIGKKSISDAIEGTPGQEGTTATQYLDMKRQQMTKFNTIFDAVINLEKQMAYLRLWNILEHWTKPIDTKVDDVRKELVNVYKTVSVNTTFEDGTKGKRIISFQPNIDKTPEDVYNQEKKSNYQYRYSYIDPNILRQLRVNWKITITPTEKNSNDLDRMKFKQDIMDAMQLFGPQSLNVEALKKRYAEKAGERYSTFFTDQNTGGLAPQMAAQPGQQGGQPGGSPSQIGPQPTKQLASNMTP